MNRKGPIPKVLLLQIRQDPTVRQEEIDSFVRYSGLPIENMEVLNVFDKPQFEPNVVDTFAALFVGGASEASVLEPEKFPFLPSCYRLMNYCVDQSIPVFASCFGFQLSVVALGGEVVKDGPDFEMGSVPITLTDAGKADLLLSDSTDGFHGISVHQEMVTELPKDCELLAYTERCLHAFKIQDKPFWAFQFHPEVDRETLVQRLGIYRERYTSDLAHFEAVMKKTQETPESNRLLKKFIERVL